MCDEDNEKLKVITDLIEKMQETSNQAAARTQHLEQELQKKEAMIAHFERRVKSETARANDAAENADNLRNDCNRLGWSTIGLAAIICIIYSGALAGSILDPGGNIDSVCMQKITQGRADINMSSARMQSADKLPSLMPNAADTSQQYMIPINDDEPANLPETGRNEVIREQISLHDDGRQNMQQHLGSLIKELSLIQQDQAENRAEMENLKAQTSKMENEMKQQSERIATLSDLARNTQETMENSNPISAGRQAGRASALMGVWSKLTAGKLSSFKISKNNKNARGLAAAGIWHNGIAGSYFRRVMNMPRAVTAEQRGDVSDIKKHDITESMRLEYSAAPF